MASDGNVTLTLDEARDKVRRALYRRGRGEDDDPCIVESTL